MRALNALLGHSQGRFGDAQIGRSREIDLLTHAAKGAAGHIP